MSSTNKPNNCQTIQYYKEDMVSIIIPTMYRSKWQSIKTVLSRRYLLDDAIKDLTKRLHCRYEIIVVCNSSDDKELVKYVTNNKHIDKYCLNSVNVGVPRSWNMGAEMAQGEFLCFINDDVEIGDYDIERMIKVLKPDGVGQVGPNGGKWFRKESGERKGLERIEEADEISGWLFLTKRMVFDEVGGFDIAYTPALCEEIDFSFAIRNAGYKCLVVPGLKAKHHHISGASSTRNNIMAFDIELGREELTARNKAYFENKWSKFWE